MELVVGISSASLQTRWKRPICIVAADSSRQSDRRRVDSRQWTSCSGLETDGDPVVLWPCRESSWERVRARAFEAIAARAPPADKSCLGLDVANHVLIQHLWVAQRVWQLQRRLSVRGRLPCGRRPRLVLAVARGGGQALVAGACRSGFVGISGGCRLALQWRTYLVGVWDGDLLRRSPS